MPTNDLQIICEGACRAARRAGEYIRHEREGFSYDKVEFKGVQNLVSYVDKQAERMLVRELGELLPGAGFIAEEGTAEDSGQEWRWIVDPLDGTTNFIHGLPPYCVSVGLARGAETIVGVVYEITHDEMFCAWEGSPAWLNGREIHASAATKVEHSLVAVGFSHISDREVEAFQRQMEYFHRYSNGVRRVGSAATDLVYVACGRFDAYAQANLQPWDVAGGALIARRAGAVVTDCRGGGDYLFGRSVIAAAPGIYQEFFDVCSQL